MIIAKATFNVAWKRPHFGKRMMLTSSILLIITASFCLCSELRLSSQEEQGKVPTQESLRKRYSNMYTVAIWSIAETDLADLFGNTEADDYKVREIDPSRLINSVTNFLGGITHNKNLKAAAILSPLITSAKNLQSIGKWVEERFPNHNQQLLLRNNLFFTKLKYFCQMRDKERKRLLRKEGLWELYKVWREDFHELFDEYSNAHSKKIIKKQKKGKNGYRAACGITALLLKKAINLD